jgi:hypothetical protein
LEEVSGPEGGAKKKRLEMATGDQVILIVFK